MLYIIYQEDGPDSKAIRAATKAAHFAYLDEHADKLVLGGALLAEDAESTRTGSVLILNVPSLSDAEAWSRDEPFRKAGLFKSVKISRMRRGQWYPQNAPSSAEGS
jgi:uncharacterized protein YciI